MFLLAESSPGPWFRLMVIAVATVPSILCIIIAAVLAAKDKEGWGWFLFIALLTAMSYPQLVKLVEYTGG